MYPILYDDESGHTLVLLGLSSYETICNTLRFWGSGHFNTRTHTSTCMHTNEHTHASPVCIRTSADVHRRTHVHVPLSSYIRRGRMRTHTRSQKQTRTQARTYVIIHSHTLRINTMYSFSRRACQSRVKTPGLGPRKGRSYINMYTC
jgi:hypothetical protein